MQPDSRIDSALCLSPWSPRTRRRSRCWGCPARSSCCPRPRTTLWNSHKFHCFKTYFTLFDSIMDSSSFIPSPWTTTWNTHTFHRFKTYALRQYYDFFELLPSPWTTLWNSRTSYLHSIPPKTNSWLTILKCRKTITAESWICFLWVSRFFLTFGRLL